MPMIYDITTDELRPVTEMDIKKYDILSRAVGDQPPEVRRAIHDRYIELLDIDLANKKDLAA
jgi:hypothetical protein